MSIIYEYRDILNPYIAIAIIICFLVVTYYIIFFIEKVIQFFDPSRNIDVKKFSYESLCPVCSASHTKELESLEKAFPNKINHVVVCDCGTKTLWNVGINPPAAMKYTRGSVPQRALIKKLKEKNKKKIEAEKKKQEKMRNEYYYNKTYNNKGRKN